MDDAGGFDGVDGMGFEDDDNDVIMDMPDFTLGGGEQLNAQDLFHEELLTQAVAPQNQQSRLIMAAHNDSIHELMNTNNVEYVLGQNQNSIVGNMGVQPLLNNSFGAAFHDGRVISNLELEQNNENGQYADVHRGGIYKRGAINLSAMNDVISKLENADFESLTSFFDSKKHGNWAGPDQWYHRRYMMTLKQSNKNQMNATGADSLSPSKSVDAAESKAKKTRKKKASTRFDFMDIARGNLIDEKEFDEPQRSFNTLTQAVLDKNRKTYHTLPKDLQIKPNMFIKLFHRENYSVWKHWLRQHQLRMIRKKEEVAMDEVEQGRCYEDGDIMCNEDDGEPAFLAQQAAAMAVVDGTNDEDDEENEFKYDYNNPLDTSHFVPDMNEANEDAMANKFDFDLNGYDLIDIDPNKKVEDIKVEFAMTAKKVNVRKLKLKIWDKIDKTLPHKSEIGKENISKISNQSEPKMETDAEEEDIDMNGAKEITFQDTLDSLPNNISSAISVHMCFICLLHLANEKELQFVPKESDTNAFQERGNFDIEYMNENSVFEKAAEKVNQVMVLGMQ